MSDIPVNSQEKHRTFLASPRRHILIITNHGVHQWSIIPGLPDTGGQNVFVNQFTAALVRHGFRVTIVNRGGYPHPVTGEPRRGLHYRGQYQRLLYLEDGLGEFVRKEDMHERMPSLTESLARAIASEDSVVDLIISHYWDGAALGARYNRRRQERVTHIWVPHSLGAVKKRNVPQERWESLRIDERIAVEKALIPELDGIVATSSIIEQALKEDYCCARDPLFLPPCVDTERYHPREVSEDDEIWNFLSQRSGLSAEEVRDSKIVTEISRTDTTKRKDVLIRAFAQARERVPDSLLVVSIDESEEGLAGELKQLSRDLGLRNHVAVVGYVWDELPIIYAVTDIYCTPSVMEGFGMSAQEAAATGVPVVASHLVPFVTEHLLGSEVVEAPVGEGRVPLRLGEGAVVVQADQVEGFARALSILLTDDELWREMGQKAYRATIPTFTWDRQVPRFLQEIGVSSTPP